MYPLLHACQTWLCCVGNWDFFLPYIQMQWVLCPHHHPLKMISMLLHHHSQCLPHQRICTKSLLHHQWKGSPGYLKTILKKVGCHATLSHRHAVSCESFIWHVTKGWFYILKGICIWSLSVHLGHGKDDIQQGQVSKHFSMTWSNTCYTEGGL